LIITSFIHEGGSPAGAAAGCDFLILPLKNQVKRSQPAAAPAQSREDFRLASDAIRAYVANEIPANGLRFFTTTR
jgi:hypothetical protein